MIRPKKLALRASFPRIQPISATFVQLTTNKVDLKSCSVIIARVAISWGYKQLDFRKDVRFMDFGEQATVIQRLLKKWACINQRLAVN